MKIGSFDLEASQRLPSFVNAIFLISSEIPSIVVKFVISAKGLFGTISKFA